MYRLPSIILFLSIFVPSLAQSPHGERLKIDCAQCHNPEGWVINYDTILFDHETTDFNLEGAHSQTDCKACHSTLVFDEAPTDCFSCHTDVHSMSVGTDCMRCHTSQTWLVDNIPEIHEENGFPLIGAHNGLSCVECHLSDTNLRFDNVGNECISCHRNDYLAVQSPDHSGFSTNCLDCHNPLGTGWDTDVIAHDFFPLTLGHDIQDCNLCHITGNYSDADPDCVSCHQMDYSQTLNPNHQSANFSTDCISCHTTNPGWMPATFDHDALFFPIYSGEHEGEWNDCVDCHIDSNNYSIFSCTTCHINPETDQEHIGISGYIYESTACLACHPTGSGFGDFDHNVDTNFILDGAHDGLDCAECHVLGSTNPPPTDCYACHDNDYIATTNPNHSVLAIPTDCVACHTTDPDWMPATFDIHDATAFPLTGAHIGLDCLECHAGGYSGTPTDCFACHENDYNSSTNPNHAGAQFPTDCVVCHTTNPGWAPSTFDHDNQYFRIETGAHEGEWNQCIDCHINPSNYSIFTCITCHDQNTTDQQHDPNEVPNYIYETNACFACHPDA